ncbi:hypothetical protein GHI93_04975 [Lactococcus hircilactis]|uniref:Uncharacterized protein n=1 Tax=Lactococcus hircilactis TaxID=1494462 RepID=A0A7X2D0C4_9LACT|nr:UPF0223 family protein [Lactococcus hircilactis]MQW39291.1 hypothetical protein [Lactococcus hircilactis]
MKENYAYPIDLDWSTDEMTVVLAFLNQVEDFYETKVEKVKFLEKYQAFKTIVPSKMQEKQIGREFEQKSGYSLYQAVKEVSSSERKYISHKKA